MTIIQTTLAKDIEIETPAFRGVYQRRLRQGAVRQHQESLQHLDLHGLPGGQEGLYNQLFL